MTEVERMLPLYQGMMTGAFDHRAADVVRSTTAVKRQSQPQYISAGAHANPQRVAIPNFWVREDLVDENLPPWYVVFSDVTSATNERTLVAAALPRVALNNKLPLILSRQGGRQRAALLAALNSFVVDYVVRQKIGGSTLNFFYVKQFPVLSTEVLSRAVAWSADKSGIDWLGGRVLYLSCTADDLAPMAHDLGANRGVFVWNEGERALACAEIDAAMFLLYDVEREDVDYIMETFPIVKRKDIAAHGEYRTKRLILEMYDAMTEAIETGMPYESPFDDLLTEGN